MIRTQKTIESHRDSMMWAALEMMSRINKKSRKAKMELIE